jgi:hypothetical protein
MEQQQAQATAVLPKLPAGLAGVLNGPEDNRDSAYYSSTDGSSKRESPCLLFLPSSLSASAELSNRGFQIQTIRQPHVWDPAF